LFALVLPLEFGDASLLGDNLQLALGHLELRLEAEGVELPVGHGGVVVRLRGVVRQRLIHDRRGGRIPVDEPETKEVVRKQGKYIEGIIREGDDHCLRRAPVAATCHWFSELRWWWKRQAWIGKGLKAKGSMKS
jgi:hypothetical protein